MSVAAIPYEKQLDSQTGRTCGAACLSMVYRSLGKAVPQTEIWPAIAKQTASGSLASMTHLMAQDAVNRGFHAVAIQARHPLQVLRLCREWGIRAILNHQLQRESPAGHYSVLVDLDDKSVVLHDPVYGPSRRLPHAELLELWLPHFPNSEIVGNVLIGIAAGPSAAPACEFCHTPIPANIACPRCQKPVGLQPAALLGCLNDGCIARMWNYLCCPSCDCMWTFSLNGPQAAALASGASSPSPAPPAASASEDPWKLDRLFAEVDQFSAYVLALPAAANHPDLKRQLDFITASKEKLKLAQAEDLARQKARREKLDAAEQAARQRQEERRKKTEEMNRPGQPLDGDALAQALLKNLGFTG
jgi:hypothetical protein